MQKDVLANTILLRILLIIMCIGLVIVFLSCAINSSSQAYSYGIYYTQNKIVKYGSIETEGVTIQAKDGSFSFKTGETFTPPSQVNTGYDSEDEFFYGIHYSNSDIIDLGPEADSHGAHRIWVVMPGLTEPLHGKILFSKIFDCQDCGGPGSRSYRIVIPQKYVEAAMGGKISVVWETYQCPESMPTSYEYQPKNWVLWISDTDF